MKKKIFEVVSQKLEQLSFHFVGREGCLGIRREIELPEEKNKKIKFYFYSLSIIISMIVGSMFFYLGLVSAAEIQNETEKVAESLVDSYVDNINDNDVEDYLELFTDDIKKEMQEYIDVYGNQYFFQEKKIDLVNMKILSDDVAIESASITDEIKNYEDVMVVYAELDIVYDGESKDIQKNGTNYRDFVLVKELGIWKIYRVSTPNIKSIIDNDEGFGNKNEQEELDNQLSLSVANSVTTEKALSVDSRASLSSVTHTTIYFTKSGNYGAHAGPRATIEFTTYLKNVIPEEWTVSHYGQYPSYLVSGAMASKMYAWYNTVYPKWNFSPYYACMKDNSDDQNYYYYSYSNLATNTYRGYVDSALSTISNKAMVISGTNTIFEVHYHATNGSQNSGEMSASGCLKKAQSGDSYSTILHYYYDYSEYTGKKAMSIVSY